MKKLCSKCKDEINISGYYCTKCKALKAQKYRRSKKGILTEIYHKQKYSSRQRNHPLPSYTKEELGEWLFSQPNFEELYRNWIESEYKKDLRPSVDRVNPLLHYTMDNIQLMTWKENNIKASENRKLGVNSPQNIPVIQLDLEGNFIREFNSIREVERKLGLYHSHISKCCNNVKRYKTAGGFKWVFKKNYNDKI